MAIDDAPAGRDQAGGIEAERGERPCRLSHEQPLVGPGSACHVAQALDGVHREERYRSVQALPSAAVARDPSGDLELTTIDGEKRTVAEWLTNFHLLVVCLDPYTSESAWVLDTGERILTVFQEADVRVSWLATSDAQGARTFLGPLSRRFLTFADPDRVAVKGMGLERLPALVWLKTDLTIGGAAEGWDPHEWKALCDKLAEVMSWKGPLIPERDDPAAFAGTPAAG